MTTAGQRRFARRLLVEHQPPDRFADVTDELITAMTDDQLVQFIAVMKAQPYRRGANRR